MMTKWKLWNRYSGRAIKWLIFPVVVVVVCVYAMGSSFSWFYDQDRAEDRDISMGSIDLFTDTTVYELPVGNQAEVSFSIQSKSTVDSYMRIGITTMFTDSSGSALPVNIPEDLVEYSLGSLQLDDQTIPLSPRSIGTVRASGYNKLFITPLDSVLHTLQVFPSGKDSRITGTLVVRYNTEKYPGYFDGSKGTLSLALVPEGIQATRSAVEGLSAYGWDPALVDQEGMLVQ